MSRRSPSTFFRTLELSLCNTQHCYNNNVQFLANSFCDKSLTSTVLREYPYLPIFLTVLFYF
jgi:hypothetical protein